MNTTFKNHFVATIGEIVGTFLFLFFAFGATQVSQTTSLSSSGDGNAVTDTSSSKEDGADTSKLLYVALGFGFSLTVNAWVFFRYVYIPDLEL